MNRITTVPHPRPPMGGSLATPNRGVLGYSTWAAVKYTPKLSRVPPGGGQDASIGSGPPKVGSDGA